MNRRTVLQTSVQTSVMIGFFFSATLLLALPAALHADTGLRCGSRLVGIGDHKRDVQKRCGEPESVSQRFEKRTVKHKVRRWDNNGVAQEIIEEREVEVTIDEWVYDFGPQRFVRYVSFEDNRVIDVRSGERGTRKD